jgi:glutaredoxin
LIPGLVLGAACSRAPAGPAQTEPAPEQGAPAAAATDVDAPVPQVTADKTTLLFSWLDGRGRVRAVSSVGEVPEDVRERVLVVDLAQSPEQRQAHRYAFFTDLTRAGADGTYPVVAVTRYNAARGEKLKVKLPPAPAGAVIVYSAEWCGFCKKAKSWLTANDVPFVERDVEKQPGAAEELKEKLTAAKVQGGGVPVIDWNGTIIMGFDKRRLEGLLAERGAKGG